MAEKTEIINQLANENGSIDKLCDKFLTFLNFDDKTGQPYMEGKEVNRIKRALKENTEKYFTLREAWDHTRTTPTLQFLVKPECIENFHTLLGDALIDEGRIKKARERIYPILSYNGRFSVESCTNPHFTAEITQGYVEIMAERPYINPKVEGLAQKLADLEKELYQGADWEIDKRNIYTDEKRGLTQKLMVFKTDPELEVIHQNDIPERFDPVGVVKMHREPNEKKTEHNIPDPDLSHIYQIEKPFILSSGDDRGASVTYCPAGTLLTTYSGLQLSATPYTMEGVVSGRPLAPKTYFEHDEVTIYGAEGDPILLGKKYEAGASKELLTKALEGRFSPEKAPPTKMVEPAKSIERNAPGLEIQV